MFTTDIFGGKGAAVESPKNERNVIITINKALNVVI